MPNNGSFLIDSATHDFINHLKVDDFIDTTNQRYLKQLQNFMQSITILTSSQYMKNHKYLYPT